MMTENSLQTPAEQASDLVNNEGFPDARAGLIAHIANPDNRLWFVDGFDAPMTDSEYSTLVLIEVDKLSFD